MKNFVRVRSLRKSQPGQAFVEYALLLSFIALLVVVLIVAMGPQISSFYSAVAKGFSNPTCTTNCTTVTNPPGGGNDPTNSGGGNNPGPTNPGGSTNPGTGGGVGNNPTTGGDGGKGPDY